MADSSGTSSKNKDKRVPERFHREGYIRGPRERDEYYLWTSRWQYLFYQRWLPATPAPVANAAPLDGVRAGVLLVHGLHEHGANYPGLVDTLTSAGFAVWAVDLPGHGRSAGPRGVVPPIEDMAADVAQLLQGIRLDAPALPIYLIGHSMGSLVSMTLAARRPELMRGLVITGPPVQMRTSAVVDTCLSWIPCVPAPLKDLAIKLSDDTRGQLRSLLQWAVERGYGNVCTPNVCIFAHLSRDPRYLERHAKDMLSVTSQGPRVGTLAVIASFEQQAEAVLKDITVPLLVLHGDADMLAHVDSARYVVESVASKDASCKIYPDAYHELLNESIRPEVERDIINWIAARVSALSSSQL